MFVGMDVIKGLVMVLFAWAMLLGMVFNFGYDYGYGLWVSFRSSLTCVGTEVVKGLVLVSYHGCN